MGGHMYMVQAQAWDRDVCSYWQSVSVHHFEAAIHTAMERGPSLVVLTLNNVVNPVQATHTF